jgi:hypothetical protein
MIEIVVALLVALRPFSRRLSFIGSIGAIITFVLTVSFHKNLVLLGASIWTAAEARKQANASPLLDVYAKRIMLPNSGFARNPPYDF